jgi:hypothetical protein
MNNEFGQSMHDSYHALWLFRKILHGLKVGVGLNTGRNYFLENVQSICNISHTLFTEKPTPDGLVKSLSYRHPGERRGPEHPEKTGFRLPPE